MQKGNIIASIFMSLFFGMILLAGIACTGRSAAIESTGPPSLESTDTAGMQHATFGLGCFWHSEEMFAELKGVVSAVPGYAGGTEKNPSYELVSTRSTRYAESVDITFDPKVITYQQLLQVFFTEHDPTTPDYSDPDEGPEYRSVAFYRNESQKKQIGDYIARLTAAKKYDHPIVTEVAPFTKFYRAEDYHIHYYRNHKDDGGYITTVTGREIERFREDFKDWLKK